MAFVLFVLLVTAAAAHAVAETSGKDGDFGDILGKGEASVAIDELLGVAASALDQAHAELVAAKASLSSGRRGDIRRYEQESIRQAGAAKSGAIRDGSSAVASALRAAKDAELARMAAAEGVVVARDRFSAHEGGYLANEMPISSDVQSIRTAADVVQQLATNMTRFAHGLTKVAADLRATERSFIADGSIDDSRLPPKLVQQRMGWFVWVGVGLATMAVLAIVYYVAGSLWRRRKYEPIDDGQSFDLTPQSFANSY